jgi:hypothetical protein
MNFLDTWNIPKRRLLEMAIRVAPELRRAMFFTSLATSQMMLRWLQTSNIPAS